MKEPAPGVVIAGKYSLERPLASGGMGSVWVARHLQLEVTVAIKFISANLAATSDGRMRFEREAKAAALIQSPHVVHVQDYGVDEGLPYIVMELLRGEDLETRFQRVRRFSLGETLNLLKQASRALRRAHEAGIVHRDLKPRNIFLTQSDDDEDLVKVLDFGIAKGTGMFLVGDATKTGHLMGSPSYMSPEQIRSTKDIDARSDLWSMGVITFRAVTGSLPFPGDEYGMIFAKIIADPIPLATHVAPDLPPAIDAFFVRALERDRDRRFQTAREMVEAFTAVALSAGVTRISSASFPEQAPTVNAAPLTWEARQAGASAGASAGAGAPDSSDGATNVLKTALMPERAAPIGASEAPVIVAKISLAPPLSDLASGAPPAGSVGGTLTKPTVVATSTPSLNRSASMKRTVAGVAALIAAGTVVTVLVSGRPSQDAGSGEQLSGAENNKSAAAQDSASAPATPVKPLEMAAPQPASTQSAEVLEDKDDKPAAVPLQAATATSASPVAPATQRPPSQPKTPPEASTRPGGANQGKPPKAPETKPPTKPPPGASPTGKPSQLDPDLGF